MNTERLVRESRMPIVSRTVSRRPGHALVRRLRAAARLLDHVLRRMYERARLRRELERFDERLLHDIGTTRLDLEAEARKPLWRE